MSQYYSLRMQPYSTDYVYVHFHPQRAEEVVYVGRALGTSFSDDIINSTNPEYVMSQIRQKYLGDSTVTIVLVGTCTHSRRYVDWELKASLRQGDCTPNGVLAFLLPS